MTSRRALSIETASAAGFSVKSRVSSVGLIGDLVFILLGSFYCLLTGFLSAEKVQIRECRVEDQYRLDQLGVLVTCDSCVMYFCFVSRVSCG